MGIRLAPRRDPESKGVRLEDHRFPVRRIEGAARQDLQFVADTGEDFPQRSRSGLPPIRRAVSSTRLSDQCPIRAVYKGVKNHKASRDRAEMDKSEQTDTQATDNRSDLTSRFKLIFSTVTALTVLALILSVLLAALGGDSEQVTAAAEACSTTYKMGFGAIVGLIGGRVA
ncbi:hypothetical protein ACPPVO_42950 [Dactylosporangium sp. McL0621]|uniref:hypothetical protein n=1 Tax=Dactylosporangium sp. McL0621 TaxID=3415678 RepID=UPI003CE949FF